VETVFERVVRVTVLQLKKDTAEILPRSSFARDFGADSLDLVELLMALEEEFSKDGKPLVIADEDAENIVTVQDAVDYIKGKGIKDE